MCALWASVGFEPPPEVIDIVTHRGPDARGWKGFESAVGSVILAHRRLTIIDLSDAGNQPMQRGDLWLIFNGEIYNYLELKAELAALGHRFRSVSDTEVLLAAFEQWGEGCLSRLNGMFAFVIYNAARKTLFAARDRFGVKPLYFWQGANGFAFGSEIKQLLALSQVESRFNPRRVYDFLTSGLLDHSNESMFAQVGQLRGGEAIRINLNGWKPGVIVKPVPWYAMPVPGSIHLNEREAADQFLALLEDSIRLQLRADVAVGSCLSGGLDSSSIVLLANRLLRAQNAANHQHTFSAVYSGLAIDERRFIEPVVEAAGVEAHYVQPSADRLLENLDRLTWHQDEPFGSTSIFAQWEVFRSAHENGVKVMLDGQGADEQLGGYHAMYGAFHAGLLRRMQFVLLIRELSARNRRHGIGIPRAILELMIAAVPRWSFEFAFRMWTTGAKRSHLNADGWGAPMPLSPTVAATADAGLPPAKTLGDVCRAQVAATNLPALLHYEDRNSMAHSVEARVPFLDHRLVELTIALGDRHKIVDGETKRLQRSALSAVLPPLVRNRQDKLGFPTPEQQWIAGPLRTLVYNETEEVIERFPDLFNADTLRMKRDRMLDGQVASNFWLWRVVSFGVWSRTFGVSS